MADTAMIRVRPETIQEMRLAASEIALLTRKWLGSDDERILALVAYWNKNKESELLPGEGEKEGVTA